MRRCSTKSDRYFLSFLSRFFKVKRGFRSFDIDVVTKNRDTRVEWAAANYGNSGIFSQSFAKAFADSEI